MTHNKAIVIGGGPGGTSAALGLLSSGYDVTLLEQRSHWTGRVCGSFLSPEAIRHLQWLGVHEEVAKAGAVPIHTTMLSTLDKKPQSVRTIEGDTVSLGIERETLEEILLTAVKKRGGEVLTSSRALSLYRDLEKNIWVVTYRKSDPLQEELGFPNSTPTSIPSTKLKNVEASLIVIAAGRYALGSFTANKPMNGWYGFNAVYKGLGQNPGHQSLHFFQNGYVGILGYSDGTANVCGLVQKKENDHRPWNEMVQAIIDKKPSLKKFLNQGDRVADFHGVGPLPFSTLMRPTDGPLLVGDSAAVGDPFFGEGIGRALGAGPMIAEAIKKSFQEKLTQEVILKNYQQLWKTAYSRRLIWGKRMRTMLNKKILSTSILGMVMSQSWIRERLKNIAHRGFIPSSDNKGYFKSQDNSAHAK